MAKTWKPSALIAVINARTDLTDMEKVKLAAKAKLEGNLTDLIDLLKRLTGVEIRGLATGWLKLTGSNGFPESAFGGCEPVSFNAARFG